MPFVGIGRDVAAVCIRAIGSRMRKKDDLVVENAAVEVRDVGVEVAELDAGINFVAEIWDADAVEASFGMIVALTVDPKTCESDDACVRARAKLTGSLSRLHAASEPFCLHGLHATPHLSE